MLIKEKGHIIKENRVNNTVEPFKGALVISRKSRICLEESLGRKELAGTYSKISQL